MRSPLQKSALVISNYGLGNAIMTFPVLTALGEAANGAAFWHMFPELHAVIESYLGSNRLFHSAGGVPVRWRRFEPHDWNAIRNFMRDHGIPLLINLRLEEPELDKNYFLFKAFAADVGITCWDLYECGADLFCQPLARSMLALFERKGFRMVNFDTVWLRSERRSSLAPTISFYLGANRSIKRWQIDAWQKLIDRTADVAGWSLRIFGGRTVEERRYAEAVHRGCRVRERVRLYVGLDWDEVTPLLSRSDLVVTHDTFVSHLCAALGIPVFVLYLATNGLIWRPLASARLEAFQSQAALCCRRMKRDGTCALYYGECSGECARAILPEQVSAAMARFCGSPSAVELEVDVP